MMRISDLRCNRGLGRFELSPGRVASRASALVVGSGSSAFCSREISPS